MWGKSDTKESGCENSDSSTNDFFKMLNSSSSNSNIFKKVEALQYLEDNWKHSYIEWMIKDMYKK